MGIPVPRPHRRLRHRAGMAAASGVLFGPLVGVNHAMGLDWTLKAFIVVVVGGMGNLAAPSWPPSSSACSRPMRPLGEPAQASSSPSSPSS